MTQLTNGFQQLNHMSYSAKLIGVNYCSGRTVCLKSECSYASVHYQMTHTFVIIVTRVVVIHFKALYLGDTNVIATKFKTPYQSASTNSENLFQLTTLQHIRQ